MDFAQSTSTPGAPNPELAELQDRLRDIALEIAGSVSDTNAPDSQDSLDLAEAELLNAVEIQKMISSKLRNGYTSGLTENAESAADAIHNAIQELESVLNKGQVSGATAVNLTGDYEEIIKEYRRRISYEQE